MRGLDVNTASTVLAILASSVLVLGGITALVRGILRLRDTIRDNTQATKALTTRMDSSLPTLDGRLSRVETMLLRVWGHLFPGEQPPG